VYECVLVIEGQTVVVDADVKLNEANPLLFDITCHAHQVLRQHNSEKSLLCYGYLVFCMLRCVFSGFLTTVFCCLCISMQHYAFLFHFFPVVPSLC